MCPLLIICFYFISKIQRLSSAPLFCSPVSTNITSPILLYAPNLLLHVSHFPTASSLVITRKSPWNMASFQGMPQSLLREMWLNPTLPFAPIQHWLKGFWTWICEAPWGTGTSIARSSSSAWHKLESSGKTDPHLWKWPHQLGLFASLWGHFLD